MLYEDIQDICDEFGFRTQQEYIDSMRNGADPFARFREKQQTQAGGVE